MTEDDAENESLTDFDCSSDLVSCVAECVLEGLRLRDSERSVESVTEPVTELVCVADGVVVTDLDFPRSLRDMLRVPLAACENETLKEPDDDFVVVSVAVSSSDFVKEMLALFAC